MATGVVDVTLSFLRLRVHDMGHVWPGWRDLVCACVVVRTRSPQSQWSRMRGLLSWANAQGGGCRGRLSWQRYKVVPV